MDIIPPPPPSLERELLDTLDETKVLLLRNMERLGDRGVQLEEAEERSEALLESSRVFHVMLLTRWQRVLHSLRHCHCWVWVCCPCPTWWWDACCPKFISEPLSSCVERTRLRDPMALHRRSL